VEQRWAEITIEASGEAAQEIAGALLTDVASCHGFSATESRVSGYLPVDERLENTLLSLRSALRALPDQAGLDAATVQPISPEVSVRFVAEADWANAWKQYFKPQTIGEHIVVKPTWEAWDARPGDVVIEIDPGMAFGTGLHPTTRLCLRALETDVTPGARVADVGTGSGILAVAAAKLGASRVEATDIDPLAVRIARQNVVLNGAENVVSVAEASVPPPGTFDLVVANILADVIIEMSSALKNALVPAGRLIASGIIVERSDDVATHLTEAGFAVEAIAREDEWAAVLARRV
jgi:ribosomal protein L11 methyltransferase